MSSVISASRLCEGKIEISFGKACCMSFESAVSWEWSDEVLNIWSGLSSNSTVGDVIGVSMAFLNKAFCTS